MEKITIYLENISDDIDKLNYCLQNNQKVNSYEIKENNRVDIEIKQDYYIDIVSEDLAKNGFKILSATIFLNGQNISYLEALTDKKAIEQAVLSENAAFNLEEFFLKDLEGAVCVITPDQTITANAVTRHYTALNSIYNLLYNDSDEMIDYNFDKNTSWQEDAVSFGNVVIQLGSNVSSTVWLPENLNTYQETELKKILEKIEEIRQKYDMQIYVEIGRPYDLIMESSSQTETKKHK